MEGQVVLIALADSGLRQGIVLTVMLALLGMACGQITSAFLDRGIGSTPMIWMIVELAAAALLFASSFA